MGNQAFDFNVLDLSIKTEFGIWDDWTDPGLFVSMMHIHKIIMIISKIPVFSVALCLFLFTKCSFKGLNMITYNACFSKYVLVIIV